TERRLKRNRDLLEEIRSSESPSIDQRLKAAASSTNPSVGAVARAALDLREGGQLNRVEHLDLPTLESILRAEGKGTPTNRHLDLTDLLNRFADEREAVREALKQLRGTWDLDSATHDMLA